MSSLEVIARNLGVSRSTVAAVLRGEARPQRKGAIARAEAIRRAAAELGYRPNAAARATSTGRFGCVTLLGTTAAGRSSLTPRLIWGLHDGLASFDAHLTFAVLPDEQLVSQGVLPKILRQQMSDGLLINYTDHIPTQLTEMICQDSIPALWINSKQPADCVRPDDEGVGFGATQRLISLGHRRVAYLDWTRGPDDWDERHYSESDRQDGYERAMRQAGLNPRVIRGQRRVRGPDHFQFVKAALAPVDRPTAVVVPCPAVPELMLAAHTLGLRVPADLSIIQIAEASVHVMGLRATTLVLPHEELGRTAGHLMMGKIEHPSRRIEPQLIRFNLSEGDTVDVVPTA